MKKLLFLSILTLVPMLASAEEALDVQNSGCLSETQEGDSQRVPTIIQTKREPMVKAFIDGIYYNLWPSVNEAEVINFYMGEVIKYTGFYTGEVEIPEKVVYNGTEYRVTSIGDSAFEYCSDLTSVTIPNSVTNIGCYAFWYCNGLTSIDIPNSVTNIADGAFGFCSSLTSITIPDSVTSIEVETFKGCYSLTSIDIPHTVTKIGFEAFRDCIRLTSITIPNHVTHLGNSCFYGCKGLTSITIPNHVTHLGNSCFYGCKGLTSITIPNSVTMIGSGALAGCTSLTSITIPNSVTNIEESIFSGCSNLTTVNIPNTITGIGIAAFGNCTKLMDIYCWPENAPSTEGDVFVNSNIRNATLHVPAGSVSAYQAVEPWKNFKEIVALPSQDDYRPFVEEGKVWMFGAPNSGNPVQIIHYFYFDGDTIIDGKTFKQMMSQQYVSPDYPNYDSFSHPNYLSKVGAWYEEDQKVYFYNEGTQSMRMMYDFSLAANDTLQFVENWFSPFIIGPKQTGGIKGFKGVYRDIMICVDEGQNIHSTFWLEGVGGIDGPTLNAFDPRLVDLGQFLMSCTVGDEVIYLNDEYEDGATPEGARKNRFDFTHTIKTKPKSRTRMGEAQSLYGEYNDQQLGINLNPLEDAYQVCITDESGKIVYEKAVNAGNIVGLSIDISAYAKGRYTVTIENSQESFTGEFETQTTGIKEIRNNKVGIRTEIYNLQGQRLSSPQKGMNIVNGQKIYVR